MRLVHALLLLCGLLANLAHAGLPDTVAKLKPGIVALGTFQKTRVPAFLLQGTGFVVAAGNTIATNAHVVNKPVDIISGETLVALTRNAEGQIEVREATLKVIDDLHDLALLKLSGTSLPSLELAKDKDAQEGEGIALIGFPIIGALGPYPATHHGIVAAITPVAIPSAAANQLSSKLIRQLSRGSFNILQLDATAYPGNSGSPVFRPDTGEVLGIVNMVLIKSTKESALTAPSGITYAIPVSFIRSLLHEQSP